MMMMISVITLYSHARDCSQCSLVCISISGRDAFANERSRGIIICYVMKSIWKIGRIPSE